MEQNATATMPVMDSGKQNSGKGLKIATAITSVVAVCGIGFGVYGMIQSSQKDNQISDLKVQIKDNDGTVTTIETPEIETTTDNGTTITIANSAITPKNYGFMASNFATHFEDAMISERTDFSGAEFSLVSDGGAYITVKGDSCKYFGDVCEDNFYRNEITSLIPGKIIDMSLSSYAYGDDRAFFVLDDGTVATISGLEATENKQAKIVEGSKDIFRLFGGYAQDTSGKIYKISPIDNMLSQFKIDQ